MRLARRPPIPAAIAGAIALLAALLGITILLPPALAGSPVEPAAQVPAAPQEPHPQATAAASPSGPPSTFPSPSAASTSVKPAATLSHATAWENEVTSLVNRERGKVGCTALRADERLRTAARRHSADMVKYNYFSHTGHDGSSFVDRIARTGYPRSAAAAENIAYGYADPAAVVKGWMGSSGHRANILNCAHKAVGVGLAYKGAIPYWTQVFGRT